MTRYLDETCDNCGERKEMYYVPWCPLCEKPETKVRPTLNFLQVVYHLQRKYPDKLVTHEQAWESRNSDNPLACHKDVPWDLMCDRIRNDVYVGLAFKSWYEENYEPDEDGRCMSWDGVKDYAAGFELMKLIVDEFEDQVEGDFDEVLWEVSW